MNIYQAELKDIKGITPLFNKYREFYRQAPDQDGAETFLKTRLKNGESVIFTASENGGYLGFAQLYPVFSSVAMKRTYILNDLFVAEHARKKEPAKSFWRLRRSLQHKMERSRCRFKLLRIIMLQEVYMSRTAMKRIPILSITSARCRRHKKRS